MEVKMNKMFGKKWLQFCDFLTQTKKGKTYIWFHPDWVMMDWKTYRKLQGEGRKITNVIYDEFSNIK